MITINEAKIILETEYERDNFELVVKGLLKDYLSEKHPINIDSKFKEINMLGTSKNCDISIFEVFLNDNSNGKRVSITNEMFRILHSLSINNALVSFVNKNKRNFRISLLTSKYEIENNKIVRISSNPRRYSYLLGCDCKCKTAYDVLIKNGYINNLGELINRFSVEVVNKQFYNEISECFTMLVGGVRNKINYKRIMSLPNESDQNKYAEFAVRLIGRLLFCWFLKEKKSINNIPLVPSELFDINQIEIDKYYYHRILEPLFFEILNKPWDSRETCFREGLFSKIPYLNGGLFAPHNDDYYSYDSLNKRGYIKNVVIPNEWFIKLFKIFSQYNFTVDENTSYDIELSIDPEMLGRIFENLLAEINPETGETAKKETGSFYTPRDVVDFMVDQSLCKYLYNRTKIPITRLYDLIQYFKVISSESFNEKEKNDIALALSEIKILDPACGSGAFPIGMLQKISFVLQQIDPDCKLFFEICKLNNDENWNIELKNKLDLFSYDYVRKFLVIKNSIYGVDIQPIAVEISRLRCFLSLIIEDQIDDKKYNRGIQPLPNLDFKFIIANSILTLTENNNSSMLENADHIAKLKKLVSEYYGANVASRHSLQLQFLNLQKSMIKYALYNYHGYQSEKYDLLFNWSPFDNTVTEWFDPEWMFGVNNYFDIVIANPPYLESRNSLFPDKEKAKLQIQLKKRYGNSFNLIPQGSDLLIYFYELAIRMMKKDGISVFITQNSWLDTEYGFKFQKFLLRKVNGLTILDSDYKAFDANINTIISFIEGKNDCMDFNINELLLRKNNNILTFARLEKWFGDYHYKLFNGEIKNEKFLTYSSYEFSDKLINKQKWGFVFNTNKDFIKIFDVLCKKGKTIEDASLMNSIKIGQGLNITKNHIVKKGSIPHELESALVPFFNKDEVGPYCWQSTNTYILSDSKLPYKSKALLNSLSIEVYKESKNKREKPDLIMPRGISSKHYCTINNIDGFSDSCVDIYLSNKSLMPNLWLFLNSTIMWVLREISGRKSLGGGLLKSEAADIKQFPIYFNFNCDSEIKRLISKSRDIEVKSADKEIDSQLHKEIDKIVYNLLDLNKDQQRVIYDLFLLKFNQRYKKSQT